MRPGLKLIPNVDDSFEGAADAVAARLHFPGRAITAHAGSALAEQEVDNRADLRRTLPGMNGLARLVLLPLTLVVVCFAVAVGAANVVLALTARTDGRPVCRAPFGVGSVFFILTCLRLTDWRRLHFPALLLGDATVEDAVEVRDLSSDSDSIFPV